jgi:hypothetical protein
MSSRNDYDIQAHLQYSCLCKGYELSEISDSDSIKYEDDLFPGM